MSIAKRVVSRPTTFLIIYILIIGLALYILPQIALDLFPDITAPVLVISTTYPGASPEEVEQTITKPMEGAISNATGVQKISSTSTEGQSIIILELRWSYDLSGSTNDVRDKLEWVKSLLPEGAGTPQIFKYDPSLIPIYQLSMEGNRDVDEIYDFAKNQIQPRLEQVDDVSLVSIYGGRERAIRVEISQNRLEAYGLTMLGVVQALSAQNTQIGAGSVYEGNFKYLVQTEGEFDSVEEIQNAVITYRGGGTNPITGRNAGTAIRLRDIADVSDSYKDVFAKAFTLRGISEVSQGVFFVIQKQSGTNSVEVADNIIAEVEEIRNILPPGTSLTTVYDTSKLIRNSLRSVTSSAILGALLAMVVLFVFLRSWKSTIIIGLSIPISLLIATMFMYFAEITLNIMTLAGLTLGIGMIVDSSIVILENIYRYREKGAKAAPAAFLGAQEMMTAITASVLTTVGVFMPLLMFKRELAVIGVLFEELALTIVIALLASLLVAITLVPVLSSKYLVLYPRRQRLPGIRSNAIGSAFVRFTNGYKRLLAGILRNKGLAVFIIILVFMISLLTLEPLGGNVGVAFLPDQTYDTLEVAVEFPVGTRYEVTETALMELADRASKEVEGYQNIFILAGTGADFFTLSPETHKGVLYINLPAIEEQIDSYADMKRKVRANFDLFPSANFEIREAQFGNTLPIDIILRTDDLNKSRTLATEIRNLLENQVDEVIEPQISLRDGLPIASIVLDRDKAYSLGLNISSVANEISAAVNGKIAGRYQPGDGDEIDILVIFREEDRWEILDLDRIYVLNQTGEQIPVSSIARIERTTGPVSIEREDRSRVVHVTAKLKPKTSLNKADAAVKKAVAENIVIDDSVILEYSGAFADLIEYIVKLIGIMAIALALVYGIMASLFESLKDPFIVFLSIFMIIPGILFMYSIMNLPVFRYAAPLSIYSAVGLLMLIGISVNNGIVLIDYMNLLRDRDYLILNATIEGCANRLRPVLMTSLTTILAMVPLAFNTGESANLVRPIGQTIIGGMIMSTLMTLFLVPILYARINRKADLKRWGDTEGSVAKSLDEGDSE